MSAVFIAGLAHAMSFPVVQNLRFEDNQLQWNAVDNAGGYNIYYFPGGPSKFEVKLEYLTTVKNATSYSNVESGLYSIHAFDESETLFSETSAADVIWVKPDGSVDDFKAESTVTYLGANQARYLVETQCNNNDGGANCTASCTAEGNTGFVTGGFCNADAGSLNASGGTDYYRCDVSAPVTLINVGAYCSN